MHELYYPGFSSNLPVVFKNIHCKSCGDSCRFFQVCTICTILSMSGFFISTLIFSMFLYQVIYLILNLQRTFYRIGSTQYSFSLQLLQYFPIQTSSNWFMIALTISGLSVTKPASKFRVFSPLIPNPAPVRFAEPEYANLPSIMICLKWTRGHSCLSIFFQSRGYLSKLFLKLTPGSLACKRRMAIFFFARLLRTAKKEGTAPL